MRKSVFVITMFLVVIAPTIAICKPNVTTYQISFTRCAMTVGVDDSVMSAEGEERTEAIISVNRKTGKVHAGGDALLSKSGKVLYRTHDGFAIKLSHQNDNGREDAVIVLRNDGTAYLHKLCFSPQTRNDALLGLTASFVGFWSER